jgi:AcrR family transcriptional regulator
MNRADREAQLLEVAEQTFAERGFKGVSMDEIAERANISKPVLYDHFGSKDGLLAAVVVRIRTEMRAAIEGAITGLDDDPDESLWVGLVAYFRFITDHLPSWKVLLAENALVGPVAAEVESLRRQQADLIAALAMLQLGPGSEIKSRVYAEAIIGSCERLVLLSQENLTLTPEALATHLLDFFWLGFERVRKGERWSAPERARSAAGSVTG